MNDTLGAFTNSTNYTLNISWDCTWNVSPADLAQIAGYSEVKYVNNLSINNTGDIQYGNNNCSLDIRLNHNLSAGRIYIDGNEVVSSDECSGKTPKTSADPLTIGFSPYYGSYFNGSIDDVMIFDRVLSETDNSLNLQGSQRLNSRLWNHHNLFF